MAGTMHRQPAVTAPAPASFTPNQADLAEMDKVRTIHDLLDVAPDLPLSVRLGLLDYAAAVLEGDRRAPTAADRAT
jgi:hypothetical protein